MGAFGLVELQGVAIPSSTPSETPAQIAALQAGVVVDADPGEQRDLLAAKPRDAPVAAVGRQPGLIRGDPGPPGDQELADLAPVVHACTVIAGTAAVGGSAGTCPSRAFQVVGLRG